MKYHEDCDNCEFVDELDYPCNRCEVDRAVSKIPTEFKPKESK